MFGYKGFQVYMYMETLKLTCANCNLQFNRSKVGLREQPRYFCSLSCSVKTQNKEQIAKRQAEYDKNPKLCKQCASALSYKDSKLKKVFCNHSCAATYNNKEFLNSPPAGLEFSKRRKTGRMKSFKICEYCKLAYFPNASSDKYCSLYCSAQVRRASVDEQIRKGTYKHSNGTDTYANKVYKRVLIEDRGHKCEMCSTKEWGGKPILLILDHINGDSSNYKLENLRLICSNCDATTPTYKGRNKGKGNEIRRARYTKVSKL